MNHNYYETFIAVADDCPAAGGVVPETAEGKAPSIAAIQYALLADAPYVYSQEDVLFHTYALRAAFSPEELAARGDELRAAFFAKSQACLRASPLGKRFGWGLHFDADGKVALCPRDSDTYRAFVAGEGGGPKVVKAMRSKRA